MDQLRAMRVFVEIADRGSLSAAAEALDTSLSAVVRTLSALERKLGVRLINRTTRRLSLTQEGERYLESSRRILSAVEIADADVAGGGEEPSGMLRVTAPVALGQRYVSACVIDFMRRYPQVHCKLLFDDELVDLVDRRIDVAIRVGQLEDSNLIAHRVGALRRIVVASPSYLQSVGRPSHPLDLRNANFVRFPGLRGAHLHFKDGEETIAVPIQSKLEYNHSASAVEACVSGAGFGVFAEPQVEHAIADRKLESVLDDYVAPPVPISVVYPHTGQLPQRMRLFLDWMRAEMPLRFAEKSAS